MNFKKLMPLTLFVLVMSTSAFGQGDAGGSGGSVDGSSIYVNPNLLTGSKLTGSKQYDYLNGTGINPSFKIQNPLDLNNPGLLISPTSYPTNSFTGAFGNYSIKPKKGSYLSDCPMVLESCRNPNGFGSNLPTSWSAYTGSGIDYLQTTSETCPIEQNDATDAFKELKESTDVAACYQDIPTKGDNPYELILADSRACHCLSIKKVAGLGSILDTDVNSLRVNRSKSDAESDEEFDPRMSNLNANAMRLRAQMDRNNWGMTVQATFIGDGRTDFATNYSFTAGSTEPPEARRKFRNGPRTWGGRLLHGRGPSGDNQQFNFIDRLGAASDTDEVARRAMALGAGFVSGASDMGASSGSTVETGPSRKETKALAEKLKTQYDTILGKMGEATQPDPVLLNGEGKLTKPQCVGAREFMAFKQLPSSPVMLQELAKLGTDSSIDPREWDHKKLRKEYDDIMKLDIEEKSRKRDRIVLLKEKIKFLERNPMIKNFMAADVSDLPKYFELQNIVDPRKKDILNYYTKNSLADRKNKLLKILSRLAPPRDCRDARCVNEYVKGPKMEELKNDMKAFFAKDENGEVTGVENEKNNIRLTTEFFSKPDEMVAKKVVNFTQESLREGFRSSYSLGSPSDCTDRNADIVTCAKIFSGYCQYLKKQMPSVAAQASNDKALIDDLDSDLASFFDPKMESNKELRDFNKEICDTPRRKSLTDTSGKPMSFWDYKESVCPGENNSKCSSTEQIENLRIQYLADYPVPASVDPNETETQRDQRIAEVSAFNGFIKRDRVENLSKDDSRKVAAGRQGGTSSSADYSSVSRDWGVSEDVGDGPSIAKGETADAAVAGAGSTRVDNKIDNSSMIDEPIMNNYSLSNLGGNNSAAASTNGDAQKVENMTDPQRQELLDDWQKEYDSWKKNKGNDGSQVASSTEAAMKARIEALEALLSQQKKLTEDQYRLLNDAIAKQNQAAQNTVAQNQPESQTQSNGRNRSTSAVLGNDDDDDNVSRGPASIADQRNTSGAGNGAGSAGVGSGAGSSSRKSSISSASDDSVAREEAKLVNVRRSSDGSITIEATNSGTVASANAVSVPVSDAQYRALQANPQSLNLTDLEKSIPKDQIAKLEKNGEITILLRNGSNPPFEVKVEKKNNKLVYSLKDKNGKDQAPVRRVFTRQALELQLKANR